MCLPSTIYVDSFFVGPLSYPLLLQNEGGLITILVTFQGMDHMI